MKELQEPIQDNKELSAEQRQIQVQEIISSLIREPGHTIYQIDLKTQVITPVIYDKEAVDFRTQKVKRGIIKKKDHWYCSALNEKNAFKKFNKMAKAIIERVGKL